MNATARAVQARARTESQANSMREFPDAAATSPSIDRDKIIRQVKRKYSGALASDTKWNELIDYFRKRSGWSPPYRSKWVNGYISHWDAEWYYHLPFPLVGVEWLDIGLLQYEFVGQLLPPRIIDHTDEITSQLASIGLDFEAKGGVVRIWGYFPKSYDDFPPNSSASLITYSR